MERPFWLAGATGSGWHLEERFGEKEEVVIYLREKNGSSAGAHGGVSSV